MLKIILPSRANIEHRCDALLRQLLQAPRAAIQERHGQEGRHRARFVGGRQAGPQETRPELKKRRPWS